MTALLLCLATLCSNDMLGILGDETLTFDPSEGAVYYEVDADGMWCGSFPTTTIPLPSGCRGDRVTVRACNAAGCSPPSVEVEVLPFVCLRASGCEEPCWPGAPQHLPHLPPC